MIHLELVLFDLIYPLILLHFSLRNKFLLKYKIGSLGDKICKRTFNELKKY